jgi:hypothetical protein
VLGAGIAGGENQLCGDNQRNGAPFDGLPAPLQQLRTAPRPLLAA